MKVLITGGMGVIGAEVSRRFVKGGIRPVLYARRRDESLIGDIMDKVDIEIGDITDLPRLMHALKQHKITHIVHMAGLVSAPSSANPHLSAQINVGGTMNVLEAARLFDIERVVYSSAKGIYGPFEGEYGYPNYRPVTEDHPKAPFRFYDFTKLMGEQSCQYYATAFGLDTVVLRFATTFGPGKTARHGNMAVTSRVVEDPAAGRVFKIAKGGDEKDDFIYNKDCAEGVFLATTVTGLKSRAFNIGTGVGHTLNDFAEAIRRLLPNAQFDIGPGLNFLGSEKPLHAVFDISRAQTELGYRPQYDLDAAVADYLAILKKGQ
jgi:UDP-glucose 4-epimerase